MIPFGISGVFQITTAPSPPTTVTLGALGTVGHNKASYKKKTVKVCYGCVCVCLEWPMDESTSL